MGRRLDSQWVGIFFGHRWFQFPSLVSSFVSISWDERHLPEDLESHRLWSDGLLAQSRVCPSPNGHIWWVPLDRAKRPKAQTDKVPPLGRYFSVACSHIAPSLSGWLKVHYGWVAPMQLWLVVCHTTGGAFRQMEASTAVRSQPPWGKVDSSKWDRPMVWFSTKQLHMLKCISECDVVAHCCTLNLICSTCAEKVGHC